MLMGYWLRETTMTAVGYAVSIGLPNCVPLRFSVKKGFHGQIKQKMLHTLFSVLGIYYTLAETVKIIVPFVFRF